MSGKKRVRSTTKQIEILIDYMTAHPRLANNEFNGPQGKTQKVCQWEQLRIMLMEHGPDKSIEQWEHTWRDLRRKARCDGASARRAMNSTGNSTTVPKICDLTSKILNTIGTESAFGITGAQETVIGSASEVESDVIVAEVDVEDIGFSHREMAPEHMQPLITNNDPVLTEPCQWGIESECDTESERLPRTIASQPLPRTTASEPFTRTTSQPLPRTTSNSQPVNRVMANQALNRIIGSQSHPRTTASQPLPITTTSQPLPTTSTSQPVPSSGVGQRRRQGLGTRAGQFLEAELATNDVLRDIANSLAISNSYNDIRMRRAYKERLWNLRQHRL